MIEIKTYYESYYIRKKYIMYVNRYKDKDNDIVIDIYLKNGDNIRIDETEMNIYEMNELCGILKGMK